MPTGLLLVAAFLILGLTAGVCILHLLRNTFRYASRRDWDELARDLKPVYTAPNAEMAAARFEEFADKWTSRYPAVVNLWRAAWQEFIVFLDYDVEIRKIICSTDEIVNCAALTERVVLVEGCPPQLLETAARSRGGRWSARTNDLDRGEDRGSVGWRWAWVTAERRAETGTGSAAALLSLTG